MGHPFSGKMAAIRHKYHCSDEIKNRIVGLRQGGKTYMQILKLLKCEKIPLSLATVKRIGLQFKTQGSVKRKMGSGRPKSTTQHDDRRLKFTVLKERKVSLQKLANEFVTASGKKVSRRTIARRLAMYGFKSKRCARKPFLSRKNIRDRIEFHKRYGHHGPEWFDRVIWSDESRFQLVSDAPERCIRRSDERFHPECISTTVKHGGGGVMVWGAFSSAGVGELIRCEKSVNAAEYLKILRKGLVPSIEKLFPHGNSSNIVFQQDNAPAHTAKVTKQYLERASINTMFWPGQSPDMNPIENLWAYIEGKLAGRRFSNADELWKAVKFEWENVEISRCLRLSRSVSKRLLLLKRAKGKAIPY